MFSPQSGYTTIVHHDFDATVASLPDRVNDIVKIFNSSTRSTSTSQATLSSYDARAASDIALLLNTTFSSRSTPSNDQDIREKVSRLAVFVQALMACTNPDVAMVDDIYFAISRNSTTSYLHQKLYDRASLLFVQPIRGYTINLSHHRLYQDASYVRHIEAINGITKHLNNVGQMESSSTPTESTLSSVNAEKFCGSSPINISPPSLDFANNTPAPLHKDFNRYLGTDYAADPWIGLLMVASHDVVYDLLCSVLYQRLSWGLDSPIIGLTFPPDIRCLQLVIAWPDHTEDDTRLPSVHVLHAPLTTSGDIERGFFVDLTSSDVLDRLTQLFLILHDWIAQDYANARYVPDQHLLYWRADQEPVADVKRRFVAQWASQVATADSPPEWPHEESERNDNGTPESAIESALSESSFSGSSMYDCVRFASVRDKKDCYPTWTCLWLLDRLCSIETLPPATSSVPPSTDMPEALHAYIPYYAAYLEATEFTWLAVWGLENNLPRVPDYLVSGLQTLRSASCTATEADLFKNATYLLRNCLSYLLYIQHILAKSHKNHETYCRPSYHAIFNLISIPEVRLSIGANVYLPRSDYFDILSHLVRLHTGAKQEYRNFLMEHDMDVDRRIPKLFATNRDEYSKYLDNSMASTTGRIRWEDADDETLGRAQMSPWSAECDAMFSINADGLPSDIVSGLQEQHLLVDYTTKHPAGSSPSSYWFICPQPSYARTHDLETWNINSTCHHDYPVPSVSVDQSSKDEVRTDDRQHESIPWEPMSAPASKSSHGTVQFPLAIAIHSVKRPVFDATDSNRLRMLLTACVKFLVYIGVLDFPVYGLFTEGTICTVTMAWASHTESGLIETHILERNCRAYDIASVTGIFNLATFLLFVQTTHAERLRSRLRDDTLIESLRTKLASASGAPGWTSEEQMREYRHREHKATTD